MFLPGEEDKINKQIERGCAEEDPFGAIEQREGGGAEEDPPNAARLKAEGGGEAHSLLSVARPGKVAAGHPLLEVRRGGRADPGERRTLAVNLDLRLHQRQQEH